MSKQSNKRKVRNQARLEKKDGGRHSEKSNLESFQESIKKEAKEKLQNIVNNQHDIPPEFAEIADRRYWDMIDDDICRAPAVSNLSKLWWYVVLGYLRLF